MKIEKIKNGNNSLSLLQLITSKMNTINKSKSEYKRNNSNNMKYINYKILLQEKDNDIIKLRNEIDYYKDCIYIKMKKRNDMNHNKRKKKINILKIIEDNNNFDIFKQKFDFVRMKKLKLIQKKKRNFTFDTYNDFKINNENHHEKNSYYNSLSANKSNFTNFSPNSSNNISNNNNNEYFNIHKSKMEYLEKRMNNLMNNLFSILESNKKSKK